MLILQNFIVVKCLNSHNTVISFDILLQNGCRMLILFRCFVSDNHFQLESQVCLAGKKKSPCKRIIGFQVSYILTDFSEIVCLLLSFLFLNLLQFNSF